MIEDRCACGDVTVSAARLPDYLNRCNCTLCRRTGGMWGYYAPDEVTIAGETRRFVRSDLAKAYLATLFGPNCGNTVAWVSTEPAYDRMGLNMRLFEPGLLTGIETRFPDGLSWTDDDDDSGAARFYAPPRPFQPGAMP